MSDTYNYPDEEDVPTITTNRSDYEFPETKTLFITYREDEWDEVDIERTLETINFLFGTEVQIAMVPESIELLDSDDARELVDELSESLDEN